MRRALLVLLFANLLLFAYLRLVATPTVVPPPSAAVRRLELVGEKAVAKSRCLSVGPLRDPDLARASAEWLEGTHLVAKPRSLEVDGPSSYWVVTTTKTPALATRLVQQLRGAGIRDVEVVAPEAAAAEVQVSLGLYGDQTHAQRRIQDLKRFALKTAVIEQVRKMTQWWLDLEQRDDAPPPDLSALVKALPAAEGAGTGPCTVSMAPPDPEGGPHPKEPSPAQGAAKLPGAPA